MRLTRRRENVEWSGGAWSSPIPGKSRNVSKSAARQAMPRSASMPSKQPIHIADWRERRFPVAMRGILVHHAAS